MDALDGAGDERLHRRATRIAECRTTWVVLACDEHPERSAPIPVKTCKDPLCSGCRRAKSAEWARVVRAWEARTATAGRGPLKFATFTQRTDASETPAQAFDRMRRHLARFMRAPRVREWFAGGGALAFFEFTWKAGRG